MSRYQFIKQVATTAPVQALCRVLHVSTAGYYQWLGRAARLTPSWEPAATAAFARHAQRYGTRRLRTELRAEGHTVGRYALRSWLRRHGLRALSTRPQRPRTTVADPAAVVAENLLLGQPAPTEPAPTALKQALTLRQPTPGLISHADRGSQYTSLACRTRIEKAQALASHSRPGNPYDKAQAEAGWSTFKTELLPRGGELASLEEVHLEVAYYLDTCFNLDRRHSALGYRSPHQFERDCLTSIS